MAQEIRKKSPAGEKDTDYQIGYTNFAGNKEKTEIKISDGVKFDQTAFLKMLGFKQDEQGRMTLEASGHESEVEGRETSGNLRVRSRRANGRKMKDSVDIERRNRQAGMEL